MIKNIVSDIGDVLVYFRWRELMGDLSFSKEAIEQLGKNMICDPLWADFDKGIIPDNEMVERFKEVNPEYEQEVEQFFAHRDDLVIQYDYTQDWLKSLKEQGLNLYYLSNYPKLLFECHKKTRFAFYSLMDGGVVSYEEQLNKPDEAIYQRLFEKYDLKPEECIFFDDRIENVEVASKLGMHAILFESYGETKKRVQQIIIENAKVEYI